MTRHLIIALNQDTARLAIRLNWTGRNDFLRGPWTAFRKTGNSLSLAKAIYLSGRKSVMSWFHECLVHSPWICFLQSPQVRKTHQLPLQMIEKWLNSTFSISRFSSEDQTVLRCIVRFTLVISGPMLLIDILRPKDITLLAVLGTWPLLVLLISTCVIAGIIMWALASICCRLVSFQFQVNREIHVYAFCGPLSC